LTAAGLSREQIEAPQSWSGFAPNVVTAFDQTVFIISLFSVLAVVLSAVRGPREER
jgi:hypothetical protein